MVTNDSEEMIALKILECHSLDLVYMLDQTAFTTAL